MKASQFLFATLKETPSDADIASSQLMVRAGLIRKIASGLYIWLPMGLRILQKVERIVREEMQNIGAQELLMPMTQPAELWQTSGRFEDCVSKTVMIVTLCWAQRMKKSSPIWQKASYVVISNYRLLSFRFKANSVTRFVHALV